MVEVVPARGAGAEAGEEEGDEAAKVGLLSHVLAGEVVLAVEAPGGRARPGLAQQRPLVLALQGIAGGEAQAVAGGEEESRGLAAAEQAPEPLARRLLAQDRLDGPAGLLALDARGQ